MTRGKSASVLTEQEVKLLSEIQEHGKITSISSEVGKLQALRRLESKGLVQKIPVPTYQLSKLGNHAVEFHQEIEGFKQQAHERKNKRNRDGSVNLNENRPTAQ